MRRHRVALTSGTVALVLAGGVTMLLGLFTSVGMNTPAGGSSPVGVAASPTAAPQTTAPQSTAPSNAASAVPGAACSPAGALGFTADMKPVRCETTAADPILRWRTL